LLLLLLLLLLLAASSGKFWALAGLVIGAHYYLQANVLSGFSGYPC